jgi:hypothetical protein
MLEANMVVSKIHGRAAGAQSELDAELRMTASSHGDEVAKVMGSHLRKNMHTEKMRTEASQPIVNSLAAAKSSLYLIQDK